MTGESTIVVVTQYFAPETGAAQTRWEELSKRWSDSSSITIITSAPDYPTGELYEGYENQWLHRENHEGVEVLYTKTIPTPSGNLYRRSLKFVWFMFISFFVGLLYTSPSIVVATSPQPLTGVSGWCLARMKRAKFVFEIRDLWPESIVAVSDFDNPIVIRLLDFVIKLLYKRADRVIVLSRAFIDSIEKSGVDPSKIAYHPNGIDLELYQTDSPHEDGLEKTEDRFTVCYVGTIGRAHGLSVVLEAAPNLPEVYFLMVGDGAERSKLEEQASALENIEFRGRIPKEDVPYVLEHSDAALVHLKSHPIFETVLPSKMLEAMASGLPIVLGVKGEARRILDEAEAGIPFEPGNHEELSRAVRRLHDHNGLREEFGGNGRQYVSENFDWETIAADYHTTITSVC